MQSIVKQIETLENERKRKLAQVERETKSDIDLANQQAAQKRRDIGGWFNVEHRKLLEQKQRHVHSELEASDQASPTLSTPSPPQRREQGPHPENPARISRRPGHKQSAEAIPEPSSSTRTELWSHSDPESQVIENKATSGHPLVVLNKQGQWVELRCTICHPAVNAHIDHTTRKPAHLKGLKGFAAHLSNTHPELGPGFPHDSALEHCTYKVLRNSQVQDLLRSKHPYKAPLLMKGRPTPSRDVESVGSVSSRRHRERVSHATGKRPVRDCTPDSDRFIPTRDLRHHMATSAETMSANSLEYGGRAESFNIEDGEEQDRDEHMLYEY